MHGRGACEASQRYGVPRPARAVYRRRWRRLTTSLWESQQLGNAGAITPLAADFLSAVMPYATAFFDRPTSRPPRSGDARHSVILRTLWDIGRPPGDCWVGTACHPAGRGRDRRPPQGLAAPGLHTRRARRSVARVQQCDPKNAYGIHEVRGPPSGAPRWEGIPGTKGEEA